MRYAEQQEKCDQLSLEMSGAHFAKSFYLLDHTTTYYTESICQ